MARDDRATRPAKLCACRRGGRGAHAAQGLWRYAPARTGTLCPADGTAADAVRRSRRGSDLRAPAQGGACRRGGRRARAGARRDRDRRRAGEDRRRMKRTVFRGYDQGELDRQYDQRAWAPNAIELINRYAADSAAVRKRMGAPDTYDYGDTRDQSLDLFRAHRVPAPIHVFIHGGAWRLLSARDSAFPAETFVRAGAHYVALDFALLPRVSLDLMVGQVRSAIAWLYRYADQFGGDRNRIYVSGHSSGAHLAGVVATTDWTRGGLPPDLIKGAVCCSGIYDLEPVRLSARNDYVQLDVPL